MTETCPDCGNPMDDEEHDFARKRAAVGEALNGTSISDCLEILAVQAAFVIGEITVAERPQLLLDFFAHVSEEVSIVDDEEVPDGPLN